MFFDKKWFFTSQGNSLNHITSVPYGGVISLYGIENNQLFKLYSNTTDNTSSVIQTALLPMGDPIRDKQALKIAIEATLTTAGTLYATVDSETSSSPQYTLLNSIVWYNSSNNAISWINNSSVVIPWITSGYTLFKTDAEQWGKYLGQTLTSNTRGFVVNGFEFEHELRARF